jgi:trans-2,3-dihydro-3-hydroxyanthranilate isomerase
MTMTSYFHYDVFTSIRFEGNQLAVFPDARGMSADEMQTLAREMNFSESTFLLPAEAPGTDIRMRIFTPGGELPMAGHPTIGSTFALADSGVIPPGTERFVFGLGIGPTPVELTWAGERLDFAWMDQRPPEVRTPASADADILGAIGVDATARVAGLPIEEISCGVPFVYVPLASRAEVDRAEPDLAALRSLRSAFPTGHNAVFLFAVEPEFSDVTVYSRMFAPGLGVPEDPATGGASGPLGCYLVAHELVPASKWRDMVSLQGVKMLRPSRIHIRVSASQSNAIERVQVGGKAVRVGEGSLAP